MGSIPEAGTLENLTTPATTEAPSTETAQVIEETTDVATE